MDSGHVGDGLHELHRPRQQCRLVGQRHAGVDVEHVGTGGDLGDGIGLDPAEVAALQLLGEELAPRRVDPLADHHERPVEADHHLPGGRAEDGLGHAFSSAATASCSQPPAKASWPSRSVDHSPSKRAAVASAAAATSTAVGVVERGAHAAPLGDVLVGSVDLGLALGPVDGPLELVRQQHLVTLPAQLAVDLGGDVPPQDDDDLAGRATPRHQEALPETVTGTASARCSPTDVAVLEAQAEAIGGQLTGGHHVVAGRLREQHDAGVVAEVRRQQLGVTVEAEPLPHQGVEVAGQEVGQEERAGLGVVQLGEQLGTGEDLVAVGAGQAFDPGMLSQQGVEVTAGAAVRVGHEHRAVTERRRAVRRPPA